MQESEYINHESVLGINSSWYPFRTLQSLSTESHVRRPKQSMVDAEMRVDQARGDMACGIGRL